MTNLVDSTQNAFLSTTVIWTMYLRKLLENQLVTGIYVKWFHHTVLTLAPHGTHFTEHIHN
jgi:hypothetical protein